MNNYLTQSLIIILIICSSSYCQIARDIAIKYLFLDTDRDNLLSTSQLAGKNTSDNLSQQQYYYWQKYQTYQYPKQLFHRYDINQDIKLSFLQLNQIVKTKLKRHIISWPKNIPNLLNTLKTQDYLLICDNNKDQYLQLNQFLVCLQAFLVHQFKSYPYKIKSLLYPNHTIGYNIGEFRELLPKSKGSADAQNQIIYLFNSFQWPQSKIVEDVDLLIGPFQGKFLQPTILYFYLDVNWDQVIDRTQAARYFKNKGGDQAFDLADLSQNGQLDQAQLIAYFMFASCMEQDCDKNNKQKNNQGCKLTNDQHSMFNKKYQTQQAICKVLQQLQQRIEKQHLSVQQKQKQQQGQKSNNQNKQLNTQSNLQANKYTKNNQQL